MATVKDQQALVKKIQASFGRDRSKSVLQLQQFSKIPPPVRGGVWISQDVFQAPIQTDVHNLFHDVVEHFATPGMLLPPRQSTSICDVPLEWIGQRKGVGSSHTQEDIADTDIFEKLSSEAGSDVTILYAHGGAFYAGSPSYSRGATTRLAKLTKGRVASVAYRLAPQHPFPTAVLDLLVAYLSLLYPAKGARHQSIPARSVVLAGDSAGGNLVFALLQVLLRMREKQSYVQWNGRNVQLPLPAGIATLSPFIDMSMSPGSWFTNASVDFLHDMIPPLRPDFPPDSVWPTTPPRVDPYCDVAAWLHPLVNVHLAQDWTGSPPMWIAIGEERVADGAKVVAARAARQGVRVELSEYMGLPHIFPVMLGKLPQSQRCLQEWARACVEFCEGRGRESRGARVFMPGDREESFDVGDCIEVKAQGDYVEVIRGSMARWKPWTGKAVRSTEKL